ncbi:MAG TPA: HAD hydrolase family protein [Candidatus Binatia bacterium]|nr:HAD hydrolase family protein [Candidatus Binatia bacterium]
MYCRVIACDFDGTGAANGRLAPETASVLASARALGFVTLLVTGRVLEDLQAAQVPFASFDAVVAENGALVWLPATNRTIQLAPPPPDAFLAELRARGIPYHAGAVVVGTWDRHGSDILHLIRRFGMASQLVYNRESLMVLPSGVDKAVGVQRALDELHRSPRSMVAFGDAENDRPLLELAEVGIAARGSVPAIATAADDRLALPGAAGVAHYVQRLLDRGGSLETPARRRIVVGEGEDGKPVALPTSGVNVTISGDPRSGKSWMAGLLVEALVEQGYVLCVFDPEGDYTVLGGRPRVLVLGADVPLPAPAALPNVLRDEPSSLVVNLAPLAHADKVRYVETAVACLDAARAVSGIPHWVVLDEAHYFLHARTALARRFEGRTGSYAFVTYRPSLLAPAVLADVNAHLVMRTTLEEERYFLTGLLQAHGPRDLVASDALARVQEGRPALLLDVAGAPSWRLFTPAPRTTAQAHHGRKYADTLLPGDRAFRFREDGAGTVARSVVEFAAAVERVPMASLRHHLLGGDFSRWAADVLGDVRLAAAFRKLEETTRVGAAPSRAELLAHVRDLYAI